MVYYRGEVMNLFNATSTSQLFQRGSESVMKVMSVTLEHLQVDHQEKTVAHYFSDRSPFDETQILVSLDTTMPPDSLTQSSMRNGKQAHDLAHSDIATSLNGLVDPDTATSLNDLAILSYSQGDYEQAEKLFKRTLVICVHALGLSHPDTATCLNNLAGVYYIQGKYEQAEVLLQQALTICSHVLDPTDPDIVNSLINLGLLYEAMSQYERAEKLYQRALDICKQILGHTHPDTVACFNNLARLYRKNGQF